MRHSAFTMVELIFVIVVVGILAKFGTDLYLQITEGYARSLYINELQTKSANAVQTIANRLTYRIKDSIRAGATTAAENTISSSYIKWKGMDIDGWNAGGWSGIVDLQASSATQLSSPGSSVGGEIFFIGSNIGTGNNEYYATTAGTNVLNGSFSGIDVYEYYQMTDGDHNITRSGSELKLDDVLLVDDVAAGTNGFLVEKLGDGVHIHLCLEKAGNPLVQGQVCKDKFVF